MNTSVLRRLWSIIERTHALTLLKLSDKDLVEQVLRQLEIDQPLSIEENQLINAYIRSRTELIRDLAYSRLPSAT